MNQRFETALKFTLRWEGGFVHDRDDPGGATNFGITQGTYEHYRRSIAATVQSVKFITQQEVRDIYFRHYWEAAGCDDLPGHAALVQFDWAVNGGPAKAIRTLQQVVGATVDGVIGPLTRAAVATFVRNHNEHDLCRALIEHREAWYRRRVQDSPRMKKFLKGWLNRTRALRRWVGLE